MNKRQAYKDFLFNLQDTSTKFEMNNSIDLSDRLFQNRESFRDISELIRTRLVEVKRQDFLNDYAVK